MIPTLAGWPNGLRWIQIFTSIWRFWDWRWQLFMEYPQFFSLQINSSLIKVKGGILTRKDFALKCMKKIFDSKYYSTEIEYIVVWFSACLRPHQELRSRTLGTQMHTYMATMYMFMSVGICATLYLKIESVEKYLNTMLKTNFQVLIW